MAAVTIAAAAVVQASSYRNEHERAHSQLQHQTRKRKNKTFVANGQLIAFFAAAAAAVAAVVRVIDDVK